MILTKEIKEIQEQSKINQQRVALLEVRENNSKAIAGVKPPIIPSAILKEKAMPVYRMDVEKRTAYR